MTEREFLKGVTASEGISIDLRGYAATALQKLDARNEKRRNTQTKEQKENEGVKDAILLTLRDGAKVASAIAASVGISTQKASALCKQLVDGGFVTVRDIKVKGKGAVKEYAIVEDESDAE